MYNSCFKVTTMSFFECIKIIMRIYQVIGMYQNNYVGYSSTMSNVAKSFDILMISLNVLINYFDDLTKLFSNLRLI